MHIVTDESGATLHYDDLGDGTVVLALHGAYSTHLEIAGALEPILAPRNTYRRLYPDLSGMGDSPPHPSVQTTGDLVRLLERLVDEVVGTAPLVVVGHSYGCHVGRALAVRRPQQVAGLALICPMLPTAMHPEPHVVVRSEANATSLVDPSLVDDYTGYFVVHTPATAERFNAAVAPSIGRFDADAVGRMMEAWTVEPDPDSTEFENPTLIVTGRHDAWTGYRGAIDVIDRYPRGTLAVVADAGHALLHERPDTLAALISDWLTTVA